MQPDDPLVVDDFEEFEFVEDFSLAVLRALGRKVPDFSDEFPIRFPIRHFSDDASCTSRVRQEVNLRKVAVPTGFLVWFLQRALGALDGVYQRETDITL